MKKLKLKIEKSKRINPSTKKLGYAARVKTNGTADYDDIAEDAAEDTTFNVDEIRAAAGIFCRGAAKRLKQGYIVDLGPIGKLYPSCTSGWVEKEEDLKLSDVKPSLYYRPSDDVEGAIKSASLVWAKGGEDDEEEEEGGDTPEPTPSGDDAVAAPTISGTTPFETSTSVTMSGPTGAEIRYTTDGSTPTSSSSLYSSAITLSATTTVKAIAIKDGVSSEVTTKVFTKSGGGGDAD